MNKLFSYTIFCCVYLMSNVIYAQQSIRMIKDIQVPEGCTRILYPDKSFSSYLQSLPIKNSKQIFDYTGKEYSNPLYRVLAVVDMPLLFKSDLEQCADWCMRFWAEYHKKENKLNELYLFSYSGKKKYYATSSGFQTFLKNAFSYANSFSLKQGCKPIQLHELQPGDMFVQNTSGGIGHVSMIVDACQCSDGKKYFLIGFSYMPAQEFHIEDAQNTYGKEAWFSYEGFVKFLNEYFPYGEPVLRRF